MDRILEILALLEALAELTAEQLVDLEAELLGLYEEVRGQDVSDETIAARTQIRDALTAVRGEQTSRDEAQAALDEQAAALDAEVAPVVEEEPEPEPEVVVEDETPEPEVEVVEPEVEVVEPEPVAAATPPARTPVASRRVPAANRPRVPAQARSTRVMQAVQAAGYEAGRELTTTAEAVAVMAAGIDRFGRRGEGFVPILTMLNEQPAGRHLPAAGGDSWTPILAAGIEQFAAQFDGGLAALTAAGGVCGPATPYYDQQTVATAGRPVRDALVGFSGDGRGAVTFVPPPQLSEITTSGGTSTTQAVDVITNAEDISNTTKPHQVFTCGTPETVIVDAVTAIVEFGNLMGRTAPEQVAAIMNNVAAAHARVAEQKLLTEIGTASTAVTSTNGGGLGSTRDLLRDWARAAAGLRDRHRAPFATVQLIAPYTVIDQMAADLTAGAYGPGDVDTFAVAREQIEGWLSRRNIAVTWSYEKASGALFTAQTAGPLRPWQTTVTAYVFFPGSFGFLDGGELNLGLVRDSTLNAANKYQMQMETFEGLLPIGVESLALTSTVCNSGGSMGTNDPDELCDDGGS